MRRGAGALCLLLVAGCGGTRAVTATVTRTVTLGQKIGAGPPSEQLWFGTIHSLRQQGSGWLLRLDPQWFLGGVTANTAAVEDGVIRPGDSVPNDYYRVDEGHRLLTFLVPANAHVTVLASGVGSSPTTVARLARLLGNDRGLFEPLSTGFWVRADVDTVRSLDQQYVP